MKSKQKVKAPAKKKKLIDGKYSHKILLRLFPEQGEKMEMIMKLESDKAFAKTIARCVNSYLPMKTRIAFLEKEVDRLQNNSINQNQAIAEFNNAFLKLQNFTLKKSTTSRNLSDLLKED